MMVGTDTVTPLRGDDCGVDTVWGTDTDACSERGRPVVTDS